MNSSVSGGGTLQPPDKGRDSSPDGPPAMPPGDDAKSGEAIRTWAPIKWIRDLLSGKKQT